MAILSTTQYELSDGQTATLFSAYAATLRVHSGKVWLTCLGDAHDYWLAAGESLPLLAMQHYTLSAEPQACVSVHAQPQAPSAMRGWRNLLTRDDAGLRPWQRGFI